MRHFALDTNSYAGVKRGDADGIEVVRRAGRLLLGVTVIGELLTGFACGERERRNREELSLFLPSPRVESPPVSTDTADAYALLYRNLKRKGRQIPSTISGSPLAVVSHQVRQRSSSTSRC